GDPRPFLPEPSGSDLGSPLFVGVIRALRELRRRQLRIHVPRRRPIRRARLWAPRVQEWRQSRRVLLRPPARLSPPEGQLLRRWVLRV
ncbi:UNVERIFIED_CONTAM: hypothetical protein GTU68_037150, partial [Idotea baltica]|nr:hypothetical protein [Idotea baltica]